MIRRRISGRKIAGIAFVGLLILAVAVTISVRSAIDRRWAGMNALLEELRREQATRERHRPVLRGEALPGNAWEDYELAFAELRKWPGGAFEEDAEQLGELLELHGAALEHLRRGVRRDSSWNPWVEQTVRRGASIKTEEFQTNRPAKLLVNLALHRARLHVQQGEFGEAADLLLDVLQFARDLGDNGGTVTWKVSDELLGTGLYELQELCKERLDPGTWARIAAATAALEEGLPRPEMCFLNDLAWVGPDLIDKHSAGVLYIEMPLREPGWRQAYSRRVLQSEAVEELVGMIREKLLDGERFGMRRYLTLESPAFPHGSNALLFWVPNEEGFPRTDDFRHSYHLRGMRMAAHFGATGEVLPLKDPWGRSISYRLAAGTLRVPGTGADSAVLLEDDEGVFYLEELGHPLDLTVDAPPEPEKE